MKRKHYSPAAAAALVGLPVPGDQRLQVKLVWMVENMVERHGEKHARQFAYQFRRGWYRFVKPFA